MQMWEGQGYLDVISVMLIQRDLFFVQVVIIKDNLKFQFIIFREDKVGDLDMGIVCILIIK